MLPCKRITALAASVFFGSSRLLCGADPATPSIVPGRTPAAAEAKTIPLVIGDTFTIDSKILGETRRINVYPPPG